MSASQPRSRRTGPSIEDVARLAGVSSQTVSRVSNGSPQVRASTAAKVLAAMEQLGYSPNHLARALRSGSSGTIGLLAYRFDRTGEAMTTQGVITAAEKEGLSVTVVSVTSPESTGWEASASRLSDQSIDGLIIIRAETETPDSLAIPAGLPVAVSDSRLVGYYPAVAADQLQGSLAAVQYLLDLGHPTVHHIGGPADSDPANLRVAAWRRQLETAGIRAPRLRRGNWSALSGYQIGLELAAEEAVSAVFCANDEMAFGLLRALHESGRRVPDDVSVIGFDGIALGEYSFPPLTTVAQDFQAIGHQLVRLLLEQIRSQSRIPQERVVIPTQLVIRGTTAPPGGTA